MTEPMAHLAVSLADRYRIERELGAGGMATVYLAEDLKHHRKVAIKVLHAELSALLGPARFLKEIELTATLQHPHILPLFDSGSANGLLYYVMPFVDGETLRTRLEREHQLPVATAVRIATEVADALQYAHGRGVVHRDIKPENILLHDDRALVADFGIALAVEQAGGVRMTQTGLSLGTPQYMAPEQAMGERSIDARSDIYSLGAVTYEMLSGDAPFTGSTAQAIVAQVITSAPRPLSAQRKSVPAYVEYAVMTALEKLPADRFTSAKEFAGALAGEHVTANVGARSSLASARRSIRIATALPLAVAVAALAVAAWALLHRAPAAHPLRASLLAPSGCDYDPVGKTDLVQLSPAGDALAFVATCGDTQSIWVRSLVTGETHALQGTLHAAYPFWSPDGTGLGFFADGRLKRVDLANDAVRDLAPALNGRGGSWSGRGVILYAPDIAGPLLQVDAGGGVPHPATAVRDSNDASHRLPYFLPDGQHFLFSTTTLSTLGGVLRVGQLGSLESRALLDIASNVAYADGRLLYERDGLLVAQPFDARHATFSGPAVSVAPRLENWAFREIANFSVSASANLLVYRPAPVGWNRVEWFDPVKGTATTLFGPGAYRQVRFSPDGRQILIERDQTDNSLTDLWLYDIAAKNWSRISAQPDVHYSFAWSRDGARIAYEGITKTFVTIASVDRTRSQTVSAPSVAAISDWLPDGTFLGSRQVGRSGWDLMLAAPSGGTLQLHPLLATPADEYSPRIGPDGRLVAYISTQTGRSEAYVARMDNVSAPWQVSQSGVWLDVQGSVGPMAWDRKSGVLYFADAARHLNSVSVADGSTVKIGRPTLVVGAPDNIIALDVAPDGRLLLLCDESPAQGPLEMIEHWTTLAATSH